MTDHPQKKKKSRIGWLILLIACLVVMAVVIGILVWVYRGSDTPMIHSSTPTGPSLTSVDPTIPDSSNTSTTVPLPENPVDFAALQKQNADIYAWIYIPNTGIDLPIVQPSEEKDDNFYLHHDINQEYDFKGMIYTQRVNAKDFSDRVTVIYGHNMLDGTMFTNLHIFRDADFFDENEFFYIYTPEHILTYRIVSAFQYDTRHIMNSFDFSDDTVFQNYLNMLLHPKTTIADVRGDIALSLDDRIVTLSTCIERGAARYLVQGVLISDEPTR